MQNRPKSLIAALSAAAVALTLLIPSPAGAADRKAEALAKAKGLKEPVTLKFWQTHNAEETDTLKGLLADLAKEYPNLKVELDTVAFAEAQGKFKTAAKAGNAPDLFRCEVAWTAELAELGYLAPLDDYLSEADRASYLDKPLAASTYKDETWALPQVTDCLALLYNRRSLATAGVTAPPKTMDELAATAAKLSDPGKGTYGFAVPSSDSYFLLPYLWSFGGSLIDEKSRTVGVDSPGAVKGLQFVLDLKGKKAVPPTFDVANDYTNQLEAFKAGKQAMILMGPWATAGILSGDAFKGDAANLGIADLPAGPGGTGSPIGGHGYSVSAACKDPDLAFAVAEFLNRPENQARFTVRNNLLPTRKAAFDIAAVKGNAIVSGFRHQLDTARTRPIIPEGASIFPALTQGFQDALRGTKTPEVALKDVAAEWRKLLKK